MNLVKIIKEEIARINESDYYKNRAEEGELSDLTGDLERYLKYVNDAIGAENTDIAKDSFEKATYILEIFEDVFESMLESEEMDYFSYEENFAGIESTIEETGISAKSLASSIQKFLDKINARGTESIDSDLKKLLGNIYLVQYMIFNLPEEPEGE